MPKKIDFDVVREIALTLPDVEESTIHGAPSLKVRGKLLTCPALHRTAEPNSLAVRIGFDQRAALLAADLGVYDVTDHYVNYLTVRYGCPGSTVTNCGTSRYGVAVCER